MSYTEDGRRGAQMLAPLTGFTTPGRQMHVDEAHRHRAKEEAHADTTLVPYEIRP